MTTATMRLEWNGEAVKETVAKAAASGLNAAADVLLTTIKTKVGFQGPPRSRPFQYPHKDTNAFYDSLSTDKATPLELVSAAGVLANVYNAVTTDLVEDYAICLEYGTAKMAPRYWAMRSYHVCESKMFEVFISAMRAGLGGAA